MAINHHLGDDLLQSYAAGTLAEGWSLAVATHLALCPECRRRLSTMEEIAGAMIEETAGELVGADSLSSVMSAIHVSTPKRQMPPARPLAMPVLPQPLRRYVGSDLSGIAWRPLGKGAAQLKLKTAEHETQVRLLRIPAGKPVPEHGHGGRELTLVLSGAFRDGEKLFARGDIEDADADLTHQPVATPEADCICLAVTDAPLRFTSWVVRLVQPVLGI